MQTQPHTHHIPTSGTPTGADDEWSQTKLRIVAAAGVLVLAAGLVFGMVISTTADASADPEPAATHGLDQPPAIDDTDPSATAEGDTAEGDTAEGDTDKGSVDDEGPDATAEDPDVDPEDDDETPEEDAETPEEDPEDPVDPVDPMDGAPDDLAPVPEGPDPGFDGPDDLAPLPTIPDPTPICCIVLPPIVPDPDPVPPVIGAKLVNP